MRKAKKLFFVLSFSTIAIAGETTADIPVTAQAEPGCVIKNTPALNIQYTGISDATGSFQLQLECDNSINYTVSIGQGQNPQDTRRAKSNDNSFILYRLYKDAGFTQEIGLTTNNTITGTGNGSVQNIDIFARVLYQENAQNQTPGTYTDTIRVTVSW